MTEIPTKEEISKVMKYLAQKGSNKMTKKQKVERATKASHTRWKKLSTDTLA